MDSKAVQGCLYRIPMDPDESPEARLYLSFFGSTHQAIILRGAGVLRPGVHEDAGVNLVFRGVNTSCTLPSASENDEEVTVLQPLSDLSHWERWALRMWLQHLADREPSRVPWHQLPPARYTRALGELAIDMGIRLPNRWRRMNKQSIPHRREVRATERWGSRKEFDER